MADFQLEASPLPAGSALSGVSKLLQLDGTTTLAEVLAFMQAQIVFPSAGLSKPRVMLDNDIVIPRVMGRASAATFPLVANRIYAIPFDWDMWARGISMHVATAFGSAANIKVGFYQADGEYRAGRGGGLPKTLIEAPSAVINGNSATLQHSDFAAIRDTSVFDAGTWLAFVANQAVTVAGGAASIGTAAAAGMAHPALRNANAVVGVYGAYTYDGNMPATFPTSLTLFTSSSPPLIGLRAAAS